MLELFFCPWQDATQKRVSWQPLKVIKKLTSTPIGADKCSFSPYLDRPTDRLAHREVTVPINNQNWIWCFKIYQVAKTDLWCGAGNVQRSTFLNKNLHTFMYLYIFIYSRYLSPRVPSHHLCMSHSLSFSLSLTHIHIITHTTIPTNIFCWWIRS